MKKEVWLGAVGGLIGAVMMGIILVGSKVMMGMPSQADFVVMGTFVGGGSSNAVIFGWVAHLLVGIIDGVIFGTIVGYVTKLRVTSIGRGIGFGSLFGLLVFILVFMPVMQFGFAPIMMTMMGAAAAKLAPTVMGLGLVEHLLYGAVVGATVWAGIKNEKTK